MWCLSGYGSYAVGIRVIEIVETHGGKPRLSITDEDHLQIARSTVDHGRRVGRQR
jgi:hypothetical protein